MIDRSEAEEHLRVIRSLMEKATVYRAISAEAAAVGGALALIGSFAFGVPWIFRSAESYPTTPPNEWSFMALWGVILLLATIANLFFLYRAAAKRQEPFFSSGMRLAATSLLPSFVAAGWGTVMAHAGFWIVYVAPIWMTGYGLALLATKPFAPRSLVWLGWAFLIAGLWAFPFALQIAWGAFYLIPPGHDPMIWKEWNSIYVAQGLLGLSFGLFHLVYAVCTWPRRAR